jgi:hypothetical protein
VTRAAADQKPLRGIAGDAPDALPLRPPQQCRDAAATPPFDMSPQRLLIRADHHHSGRCAMSYRNIPIGTWMVVEGMAAEAAGWNVVSAHPTQAEAEAERDRRNRQASPVRYRAWMLVEPVAERMGRPCH